MTVYKYPWYWLTFFILVLAFYTFLSIKALISATNQSNLLAVFTALIALSFAIFVLWSFFTIPLRIITNDKSMEVISLRKRYIIQNKEILQIQKSPYFFWVGAIKIRYKGGKIYLINKGDYRRLYLDFEYSKKNKGLVKEPVDIIQRTKESTRAQI